MIIKQKPKGAVLSHFGWQWEYGGSTVYVMGCLTNIGTYKINVTGVYVWCNGTKYKVNMYDMYISIDPGEYKQVSGYVKITPPIIQIII